jgi:hypothetical protein
MLQQKTAKGNNMKFLPALCLTLVIAVIVPVFADDGALPAQVMTALPPELMIQYGKYSDAIKKHDYSLMSQLMTSDFTRTYEGHTVSHERALSDTHQLMDLMSTDSAFPQYQIKIEKFFVKEDRATVYIEEKISDVSPLKNQPASNPASSRTTFTYEWIHHWIKTPAGWKLSNVTRHLH